MSSARTVRTLLAAGGCVIAAAAWLMLSGGGTPVVGQPGGEPPRATPPDPKPDETAVRAALDSFVAAFRKGDGKAVAAHWTAAGEYTDDDGTTFRGRPALEKAYAEFFAKNPGPGLEVEVDSVRSPSRDTAVVEGHFKLRRAKGGDLAVSRCSFLYAREDGKWLIAIAREWPGDGLALRDLDWMIGEWEAKRDGTVVRTKYEWTANKSFIRCQYSITRDGDTSAGMQMTGKDPATGALRVWTFDDDGGVGDADVTRDGKKWVHTARGVTADGRVLTATNILTPAGADVFLWHAVGRTLDGDELPDLPPIKVTRVPARP